MTATVIIRIVLEVLGLIAIGVGLVGGIVTMFREILSQGEAERSVSIDTLPTTFIEALVQLLQALIKAPVWLALVIIGILLVFGSNLVP